MTARDVNLDAIRVDGDTQARAAGLDLGTVAEYVTALEDGATFPPVTVIAEGSDLWLADGFHRVEAHRRAGRETIAAVVTEGTRRDAVLVACTANATHGLRRTNADKRRAVARLLADPEWATWSDREIGRHCGVSNTMVSNMRAELVAVSTVDSPVTIVAVEEPAAEPADDAEGEDVGDDVAAPRAASDHALRVLNSSDSNEWYTPAEYVDAAREVMGAIDLDPASCAAANVTVRAATYYTQADDGLARPWHGRVWCNPPYGRNDKHKSNQDVWTSAAIAKVRSGEIREACILVNSRTGDQWFQKLWEWPICYVAGRIPFAPGESAKGGDSPVVSSVIVYVGAANADRFREVFARFGRVVMPDDDRQRDEDKPREVKALAPLVAAWRGADETERAALVREHGEELRALLAREAAR